MSVQQEIRQRRLRWTGHTLRKQVDKGRPRKYMSPRSGDRRQRDGIQWAQNQNAWRKLWTAGGSQEFWFRDNLFNCLLLATLPQERWWMNEWMNERTNERTIDRSIDWLIDWLIDWYHETTRRRSWSFYHDPITSVQHCILERLYHKFYLNVYLIIFHQSRYLGREFATVWIISNMVKCALSELLLYCTSTDLLTLMFIPKEGGVCNRFS